MLVFSNIFKNGFIRQVMLLAAITMLAACEFDPNPVCVENDDLGNSIKKEFMIEAAKSDWVDSGIEVEKDKRLAITSTGNVHLCLGKSYNILEEDKTVEPVATSDVWQDSVVVHIKQGSRYDILIDSGTGYNMWSVNGQPSSSFCANTKYVSSDCWSRDGKGLFAYIGDKAPDFGWVGNENQDDGVDSFFELYRRDSNASSNPPDNAGYKTLSMFTSGKLWLRYRDAAPNAALQNSWTGPYSDNRGGYKVYIKRYSTCPGSSGKFLQASIGTSGDSGTKIDIGKCSTTDTSNDTSEYVCSKGVYSNLYSPAKGKVWVRVEDKTGTTDINGIYQGGDGDYSKYNPTNYSGSNEGSYSVKVVTVKPEDQKFSSLINNVIDPVRKLLLGDVNAIPREPGLTERIFNNITANGNFIKAVRAFIALSIVLMAFGYMTGITDINSRQFIHTVVRFSLIIAIISPNAWEFFYQYLFSIFIEGMDSLIWLMTSSINDLVSGLSNAANDPNNQTGVQQGKEVFHLLNSTLMIIFSPEANIKIAALLVAFPIGPFFAITLYIGIFFFLYAVARSLLIYLVSIIMIALLISLAPIFFCFAIFNYTMPIFQRWIKQMLGFALQPLLLFIVISMFNVLIILSLYNVLNFGACYGCIWDVDLIIFPKFCAIHGYMPWGMDDTQDVATKLAKTPIGFFYILIFTILSGIMLKFTSWVESVANGLTGSNQATQGASGTVNNAIKEATQIGKTTVSTSVDASKFALRSTGRALSVADSAFFGYAVSSSLKMAARSFLKPDSIGSMGEEKAHGTGLMTHAEKKGYDKKMVAFNKLSKEQQQAYKEMMWHKHQDQLASGMSKKDIYNQEMAELAKLGRSDSANPLKGNKSDVEVSQEYLKRVMDSKKLDEYSKKLKDGDLVGATKMREELRLMDNPNTMFDNIKGEIRDKKEEDRQKAIEMDALADVERDKRNNTYTVNEDGRRYTVENKDGDFKVTKVDETKKPR